MDRITIQKRGFSKNLRGKLLTIVFMLLINVVDSQNRPNYTLFTSSDGLSQSTVNCLLQDEDGFLWIGTQDGLNVYDGIQFSYFHNQPGDSTSLSDNYVTSIYQEPNGSVWVGTMSGGLNSFDKKTETFTRYCKDPNKKSCISDNTVWTICSDPSGNIYTGTNKGLNILDVKSGDFSNYNASNCKTGRILPSDLISCISFDPFKTLWIGTNQGICTFSIVEKSFSEVKLTNEGLEMVNLTTWSMISENDRHLLIGTNLGIFRSSPNNSIKQLAGTQSLTTIWTLSRISNNEIWAGTRKSLFSYDINKQQYFNLLPDENKNVWGIIQDRSGLFWVGCDDGLIKIEPSSFSFKTYDDNLSKKLHLSGEHVNSILLDQDNTLWVGMDGQGLNRLREGEKEFTVFKHHNNKPGSITGNRVWSLIESDNGLIWIGTYDGGLSCFDKKKENFTHFKRKADGTGLSNNRIMALHEDKKGNIWIGTRGGGLNKLNTNTNDISFYKHDPENKKSLLSNTVLSISEDMSGNIWVGTYKGGLSILNEQQEEFTNYTFKENEPGSLSSNNVWTILPGKDNRMWLGTQGGLNWTKTSEFPISFQHITTKHGLPGNVIFGLKSDEQGNLWMSTFKGIAQLKTHLLESILQNKENKGKIQIDPFNPLVISYGKHDGIHGNEFSQGASYKSANGTIFFGGLTGMTYFHPDSIQKSSFNPPVVLTGFKIFNKEVQILKNKQDNSSRVSKLEQVYYIPEKITWLSKLELSYRESVFSFNFSSLDFTNPDQNHYAYIMEGFESEWNYVGNQNSATYTNLDPGEYVFRVKASNADKQWSKHEVSLPIHIQPPYWETKWFYLLITICILLVLFLVIRRIIHSQKKNAFAEKEKIELQLKTIKNQIDPHFAFNAMNMIGSMVYKSDPDTVYDYFTRFAQLIRSTLQDSAKVARPLSEELDFVKNYVEIQKTRFKNKFDFQVSVHENTNLEIEVPKMVIQTFVENAIKHGLMPKIEKGLLKLDIHQENNHIQISILDNGIGRIKAADNNTKGTKQGMFIMGQIFSMYNKLFKHSINQEIIDHYDKDGKSMGTEVILNIHLHSAN